MPGHAHEPAGSVFMMVYQLNLNRYRRIVNRRLEFVNTFLVSSFEYPLQPRSETDRVYSRCSPEEALELALGGEYS
jgi:hypothetical protein